MLNKESGATAAHKVTRCMQLSRQRTDNLKKFKTKSQFRKISVKKIELNLTFSRGFCGFQLLSLCSDFVKELEFPVSKWIN